VCKILGAEEWIEIPVPAIIAEETFALAAERLQAPKKLGRRRESGDGLELHDLTAA
jgi:hypothetical protein